MVAFRKLKAERTAEAQAPAPPDEEPAEGNVYQAREALMPPGTDAVMVRLAEAVQQLEPHSLANLSEQELQTLWGEKLVATI